MIQSSWYVVKTHIGPLQLPSPPYNLIFQPMEVYIDDEAKLTLHGLRQHYVKLKDSEKNRKLFELLDVLEFNQVRLQYYCMTIDYYDAHNRSFRLV